MDSIPEDVKARLNAILPEFSARGFNLNGVPTHPNILLANESSLLLKYSDEKYFLFATYDFDPTAPNMNHLKADFEMIKVVALKHALQVEDRSKPYPYHKVPDWLNDFKNLESLILDNVDLQNDTILEGLNLKVLGIQKAKLDSMQLIEKISKMGGLEFLLYRSTFSFKDVEELKRRLPLITIINTSVK
ncbi:MAG TPA: hypothetical protein VIU12_20605 [Chryseolinea sp.]